MEQEKNTGSGILECVKVTNGHPNKLNEEGKMELAHNIIEELPIEEIDKFLEKWKYNRKNEKTKNTGTT